MNQLGVATRGADASVSEQRPRRLADVVVHRLIEAVVSGQLPAGSALPPEPDLAITFGVSRTVIREAVKELQEKGLAQVQQGRGTTVLPIEEWKLLDNEVISALLADKRGIRILSDLVQVRLALEPELVASATRIRDVGWIEELEGVLAAMSAAQDDPDAYGALESQFHLKLVEGSQNLIGVTILKSIWRQLHLGGTRWTDAVTAAREDGIPANIPTAHRGHEKILREVKLGRPEAAGKAAREHIASSWEWLTSATR